MRKYNGITEHVLYTARVNIYSTTTVREFPPLLLLRKGSLGTLGHELLVLLPEGVDSINHLLDELNLDTNNENKQCQCNVKISHLGVAEPVLVGDVIGDPGLAAGLAPGASRLEAELLASKEDRNKPVLCTVQVYTLTWL